MTRTHSTKRKNQSSSHACHGIFANPKFGDIEPNTYIERNPVLNSADDITDELLEKFINNDLDPLTINYEFTRSIKDNEEWDEWINELKVTNPFKRANMIKPIRRIKF